MTKKEIKARAAISGSLRFSGDPTKWALLNSASRLGPISDKAFAYLQEIAWTNGGIAARDSQYLYCYIPINRRFMFVAITWFAIVREDLVVTVQPFEAERPPWYRREFVAKAVEYVLSMLLCFGLLGLFVDVLTALDDRRSLDHRMDYVGNGVCLFLLEAGVFWVLWRLMRKKHTLRQQQTAFYSTILEVMVPHLKGTLR